MGEQSRDTRSESYARRLDTLENAWWKRWLFVQAPYRWNIRRLELGRTLDIGCGLGRNLIHLGRRGVGVDHNASAIEIARGRGCTAYLGDEFRRSADAVPESFDALLLAHVLEHMQLAETRALLAEYLEFLRSGGKVVLIRARCEGVSFTTSTRSSSMTRRTMKASASAALP